MVSIGNRQQLGRNRPMNGGTTAPPSALQGFAHTQGVVRQGREQVAPQGLDANAHESMQSPGPHLAGQQVAAAPHPNAGLGQATQVGGLGGQLQRRVASGAITQQQAEHTANEREELEHAYGSDWRQKLYGDTGYTQNVRQQLAAEPENKDVKYVYEELMKRRQQMLEHAQEKF